MGKEIDFVYREGGMVKGRRKEDTNPRRLEGSAERGHGRAAEGGQEDIRTGGQEGRYRPSTKRSSLGSSDRAKAEHLIASVLLNCPSASWLVCVRARMGMCECECVCVGRG